jgi:hypothetical protein
MLGALSDGWALVELVFAAVVVDHRAGVPRLVVVLVFGWVFTAHAAASVGAALVVPVVRLASSEQRIV